MRNLAVVIGIVVLASACSYRAELPTAEDLLAKVTAAYGAMRSFEVDTREVIETHNGTGTKTAHLAMEKSEKAGRAIEKFAVVSKETQALNNGRVSVEEGKIVSDGNVMWGERRRSDDEVIRVRKEAAEGPEAVGLCNMFAKAMARDWKRYHLKVAGQDAIDGEKMYLLEGSLDPAELAGNEVFEAETHRVWVRQADFVIRRTVTTSHLFGRDQPAVVVKDWLNVKVNQPVAPALFVYTPPEGASIDDKTQEKPKPRKEPR